MGKSFSIPLFFVDTDDTVKMLTGKTVTLRESPDFSSTLYTLAETSSPGVYKNDNVEDKIVRLYVDGVYKESYGTFRTYGDLAGILADYLKKVSDVWELGNKALNAPLDPTAGTHVGDRDYNDARYLLLSDVVNFLPGKTLIVSDQLTAKDGKIYNTPQAAINYAQSQSPYQSNFWKIYIYPHANSDTGYSGDLTFQPNIKLIGMGMVKVSGALSGFSQYTHFENIMFQHSGNLTLSGSANFRNCVARLTGSSSVSITIDTINAIGLGLLKSHGNHTIVSNGNNSVTGYSNFEIAYADTDKCYIDFLPGISNFDACNPAAP